jgi:RNA polymerase sigma factor (sigma-70 family)
VRDADTRTVVEAAAAGDQQAWSELVRRYGGLVLATARSLRLPTPEAEDISQLTWLSLAMHIRTLRDPLAIGGWLVTTARREGLRLLQHRSHEYAVGEEHLDVENRVLPAVDEEMLRAELRAQIRSSFARLPERCQQLLRLLARDPPASYGEVSAALSMPLGSIGPVRARCLEQLRRSPGLSRYLSRAVY